MAGDGNGGSNTKRIVLHAALEHQLQQHAAHGADSSMRAAQVMEMSSREGELTIQERGYLAEARRATKVRYALEAYARLWGELDARLGKGNEATASYISEFKSRRERELSEPDNPADAQRVELMEVSFLFPRIFPEEVSRALFHYSVSGKG